MVVNPFGPSQIIEISLVEVVKFRVTVAFAQVTVPPVAVRTGGSLSVKTVVVATLVQVVTVSVMVKI